MNIQGLLDDRVYYNGRPNDSKTVVPDTWTVVTDIGQDVMIIPSRETMDNHNGETMLNNLGAHTGGHKIKPRCSSGARPIARTNRYVFGGTGAAEGSCISAQAL
jgi:hypothetical protein